VDDAEDATSSCTSTATPSSIPAARAGAEAKRDPWGRIRDYWAGSYSASLSDYRSEWVFNWDGHNNFWNGRVLNTTETYLQRTGNIYTTAASGRLLVADPGRIWARRLRFRHPEASLYMGTSATMPEAAAFAMQSDQDLFDGLHAGTLNEHFVQRRFLNAGQFDVPVLTHVPLPDTISTFGPFPVVVTVASVSPVGQGACASGTRPGAPSIRRRC